MIDVVVAVDVEYEAAVVSAVSRLADAQVVRRPADETELLALAAGGTGQVVVLSRWFPGADADVVARLLALGGRVVGYGDDEALFARWGIAHTVRAGAEAGELGAALRDCAEALRVPPRPTSPPGRAEVPAPRCAGPVTAVWGTGSSPGRSTVAVVAAHLLARTSGRTVLVDADTVSSSLAPALGLLDDAPQLAALCRLVTAGAAGSEAVGERLSLLEPGFEVVTGLARAERWPEIRAGVLTDVLDHLAARAEHVVVDVSDRIDPDDPYADPHYDRHQATRSVLDRADHVLLVASADPLGLQRLVRLLESERAHGLRRPRAVAEDAAAGPGDAAGHEGTSSGGEDGGSTGSGLEGGLGGIAGTGSGGWAGAGGQEGPGMTVVVNRVRESAAGPGAEERIRGVLERFAGLTDLVLLPEDRPVVDAAVLSGRSPVETARRSALVRACEEQLLPRLPGVRPGRARSRGTGRGRRGRRDGRGRMSA
jgi:MinD-like ATPase involved in chromosome partitioning or flagellar assembly